MLTCVKLRKAASRHNKIAVEKLQKEYDDVKSEVIQRRRPCESCNFTRSNLYKIGNMVTKSGKSELSHSQY